MILQSQHNNTSAHARELRNGANFKTKTYDKNMDISKQTRNAADEPTRS